jgi:plastocyanin
MGRTAGVIALAAGALLALPGLAAGQYPGTGPSPGGSSPSGKEPAAKVGANGNAFTGGLSFTPRDVTVRVGDIVRWTNTDFLVPHTATEDHGLWDLGGTYGGTSANPPGFGPGESVQREFSAGTFNYFCRVHPAEMKGSVSVPVDLSKRRRKGRRRFRVIAEWSEQQLPAGQVFDVQRRKNGGAWRTVRDGSRELRGRFGGRRGQRLFFRARVREADHPAAASAYSPAARIKLG